MDIRKHFRAMVGNARSFFAPGRSAAPLYIFDLGQMQTSDNSQQPVWAGLGVFISMERTGMDIRIWTDFEDGELGEVVDWLHVYTGLSKKDLRRNIITAPDFNPKTKAKLFHDYLLRLTPDERARLQAVFVSDALIADVLRGEGVTVFLKRRGDV